MKKNETNNIVKTSTSKEVRDFFLSLNEENEENYILALRNSSQKLWTYLNEDGLTALHHSIFLNLFELSKEIIEHSKKNLSPNDFKYYINQKTNKGQTPLHYASFVGNIKLIKILIQNDADIFAKTNNGLNVLHLATMGNKITSFYYFIERYKMRINSKDNKENTSLHLASYFNSKKIFNFLLTNPKIDINSKNKDGFTPLHFAVDSKNKNMIIKLLIKGADISIKNNKSYTPQDLAKQKNLDSLVNIFKGNKCKYQILMYSNYIKIFLIILSFLPFLLIFYIEYDIKLILYLLWLIVFIYFIIRFCMSNPTNYNNKRNFLLNILENEESSIEDYCIKCQIIQRYDTVHCLICNKCIEGFDHHCFWINKCVGAKNKKYFYYLICAMQIQAIINFFICILCFNKKSEDGNNNHNFNKTIRILLIVINTLILICSTIVICPLIKFYYSQSREKMSNNIDYYYERKSSNRLLHKLDEEEFI